MIGEESIVADLHKAWRQDMKAKPPQELNRRARAPGVQLPHAFQWKARKAATSWEWFWVFDSLAPIVRPYGLLSAVCLAPPSALGSLTGDLP
jgi:hypothetical protein